MGNLKRRVPQLMTLCIWMTLLTGCWDRVETNDMAFVLTSSVDLEEDGKYRVAYLFPLPGSMGGATGGGGGTGGGKSYYIDAETGTTIREASSKLQKRMSRKMLLSHRRTIVIGEKLAKAGIHNLFDAVPRTPDSRLTCYLIVTKGNGYELLNAEPKFERFPAEVIRELTKSRQSIPTTTKDIGIALSFNSDPIMTYLEKAESQSAKKPSQEIQLAGYGQFKGTQMVGIYKNQEANGLLWLRNNVKEHTLTFPMDNGKVMSILVTGGRSSIQPQVSGDQVTFQVTLDAFGIVREDNSGQDLNESKTLHKVERKFAEQIKKSIQATVKQMQKEDTDSAQLGLLVWRKYPYAWKHGLEENWPKIFKKAEFRISVETSIVETGLINQNIVKEAMHQ
ncbi:Ger(x)C family spore germination protein [Paenibacillus sp. GCM10027628]|uniref:Ger(x)C family spore germination protein n=1 Tax=Paenibacillus sp. GCM10027628 TaxID=3273413 RepID=UPI00363CBE08